MDFPDILHIPEGINFECSGCGNCCLIWPVPASDSDYERIVALVGQGDVGNQPVARHFRKMQSASAADKLSHFSYTLEKQADGRCAFLTEDDRCRLHTEFGAEAKPGMCQLFPYTFTDAPDGYYASVSFASTAVLFNAGRALSDQEDFLRTRLALFKRLFPQLSLDWSKIELYDGSPLRWPQYLAIEEKLRRHFRPLAPGAGGQEKSGQPQAQISRLLLSASRDLLAILPGHVDLERTALVETTPEKVDWLLIRHLHDFYFPEDVLAARDHSFGAHALMQQLVRPPDCQPVFIGEHQFSWPQICQGPLPAMPPDCEELLARFVYARLFSKLYFGPGLAHLSVIAGFHHLGLLLALLRIKLKLLYRQRCGDSPETRNWPFAFSEFAELLRALERRLTSARYSREASSILQVLLESPARFERIMNI